jgi:hypothetical protein
MVSYFLFEHEKRYSVNHIVYNVEPICTDSTVEIMLSNDLLWREFYLVLSAFNYLAESLATPQQQHPWALEEVTIRSAQGPTASRNL